MRAAILALVFAALVAGCSGGSGSNSRAPDIRTTIEVASVTPRLATQIEICLYNAGQHGARVGRTLFALFDADGARIYEGTVQIPAPNIPGNDPPALWPGSTACNSVSVGSDRRDDTREIELALSWQALGQDRTEFKTVRVSYPYQR